MRVIILAAGQGKRLLPLTADVPKALLDIGGKTLLERQIEAFAAHGISDFAVVTGYASQRVEKEGQAVAARFGVTVSFVYNPFFAVADNLASCWMARHVMDGDFIQVNGDNVFREDLVQRLLAAPPSPVAVAINRKQSFDADDMKVMLDGERLTEVGKTLPVDAVDGEAVGFYMFRGAGVAAYVAQLEQDMREAAALRKWFPASVGALAKQMSVTTISVTGLTWCEVDFPADLQSARQLVSTWS